MNANEFNRRRFLAHASPALALLALTGGGSAPAFSAPLAAGPRRRAEEIMDPLSERGREFYPLPRVEGQLLHLLARLSRAQRVLELGTGFGWATTWLALALAETGGKLTTLELLPERVEVARRHVAAAEMAKRVTFLQGDAHEMVTTLKGPFDLVLLGADKSGNLDYFQKLHPKKLAPGALLVAPNALRLAEKMKDYLDTLAKHPDFTSVTVGTVPEDGFCLSMRLRA